MGISFLDRGIISPSDGVTDAWLEFNRLQGSQGWERVKGAFFIGRRCPDCKGYDFCPTGTPEQIITEARERLRRIMNDLDAPIDGPMCCYRLIRCRDGAIIAEEVWDD